MQAQDSNSYPVLSLNVSPSLRRLDRPLLKCLSRTYDVAQDVAQWEYRQTDDEPCSLTVALVLLHDHLKNSARPVHLIGHGTGGLLGLLYARQHPKRVKSLSLLSVGVHPAVNWQAHYYVQRQLLSCSREAILVQMAQHLFRSDSGLKIPMFRQIQMLEQDLENSLSPHSLFRRQSVPSGNISSPLMVCGGAEDIIVDPNQLWGWSSLLKPEDRIWSCPESGYFFHFSQPERLAEQLIKFWSSCALPLPVALKSACLPT